MIAYLLLYLLRPLSQYKPRANILILDGTRHNIAPLLTEDTNLLTLPCGSIFLHTENLHNMLPHKTCHEQVFR